MQTSSLIFFVTLIASVKLVFTGSLPLPLMMFAANVLRPLHHSSCDYHLLFLCMSTLCIMVCRMKSVPGPVFCSVNCSGQWAANAVAGLHNSRTSSLII